MPLTIEDLKKQRRWIVWRLEAVHGKQTKVPYQPSGRKAMANNPATWHTYGECAALASQFSGVGLVLGTMDGVNVWGVDIDGCCDAVTGKFTPETREIVIGLDSYGEYSPSGTGCHVLGLGKLPGPGLKKTHPGCKAVEVKSDGYYFTFTDRHLSKTPVDLMDRQDAVLALYDSVARIAASHKANRLTVTLALSEEDRFQKLMAGDMSDYKEDHSTADFVLCVLLAKKHGCNPFKVDTEFRTSGLYREKWERDDYRESTITRAVTAVAKETPVILALEDEPMEDDSETEWLVESLDGPDRDGWFPKGELSLIGASSGVGKTSWAMPLLEKIRNGEDVWGHKTKPRDYRVLLHDRSKKATRRTARALRMGNETMKRVIRLSTEQQTRQPAEILQAAIEANPGVEVWFIEGLDLWIPEMHKASAVAPVIDGIQRIATRFDIAVIATVGAPKQKGKDRYYGRDSLFGSQALARKVETVVLLSLHNEKDLNSTRMCWVLPRAGRAEQMFFAWKDGGLVQVAEPDEQPVSDTSALVKMHAAVRLKFGPDEPIKYLPSLGAEKTFYRWRDWAVERGSVVKAGKKYYFSTEELSRGVEIAA